VFTDTGASVPVTVVQCLPNRITQIKTADTDGYYAVQITSGKAKQSRVNKALAGHYAKANVEAGRGLWEIRLSADEYNNRIVGQLELGSEITVEEFKVGQYVDATGTTKGKGFAGTVKRHGFRTQDASHGNSLSHRVPGSIGQCQTPGRVFKGKKMAGQMGNVQRTIQNLQVVDIDSERHLLLIKGAIPGANGGHIFIHSAIKKQNQQDGGMNNG